MPTHSFDTQAVHAGEPRPRIEGAITPPIFQTSTYLSGDQSDYHDIRYLRLNNSPNHLALHAKLAALECGEAALVTGSGMAAVSTAILSTLKSGDHLLAQRGIYGGTHTFIADELPDFGIAADFVDLNDADDWAAKIRPNTRAFYVESMTNPCLEIGDLAGVVKFARAKKLTTLIDNTLATPLNFRPIEHGFNIVIHSATKYLNGHSDLVAGAIIGDEKNIAAAKRKLDHLGATLDPHACFLLHRGLKTLHLRMRQQNQNADSLAYFLRHHAMIEKVHYPGLKDHPNAARAKELFSGFGGLLSFAHRDGKDAAHRIISRLKIGVQAVSLGGVETLITLPAETSHVGLSATEREAMGITDGLIRVAVGVEGEDDLLWDFGKALE